MLDDTRASLAVEATGLALIFLLLVPSLQRLLHNLRTVEKKEYHGLYEDADGITTEKAEAEYSVKYAQIAVCIASAVGLVTSFALAVMSTMQYTAVRASVGIVTLEWLLFAAWVSSFYSLPIIPLSSPTPYSTLPAKDVFLMRKTVD